VLKSLKQQFEELKNSTVAAAAAPVSSKPSLADHAFIESDIARAVVPFDVTNGVFMDCNEPYSRVINMERGTLLAGRKIAEAFTAVNFQRLVSMAPMLLHVDALHLTNMPSYRGNVLVEALVWVEYEELPDPLAPWDISKRRKVPRFIQMAHMNGRPLPAVVPPPAVSRFILPGAQHQSLPETPTTVDAALPMTADSTAVEAVFDEQRMDVDHEDTSGLDSHGVGSSATTMGLEGHEIIADLLPLPARHRAGTESFTGRSLFGSRDFSRHKRQRRSEPMLLRPHDPHTHAPPDQWGMTQSTVSEALEWTAVRQARVRPAALSLSNSPTECGTAVMQLSATSGSVSTVPWDDKTEVEAAWTNSLMDSFSTSVPAVGTYSSLGLSGVAPVSRPSSWLPVDKMLQSRHQQPPLHPHAIGMADTRLPVSHWAGVGAGATTASLGMASKSPSLNSFDGALESSLTPLPWGDSGVQFNNYPLSDLCPPVSSYAIITQSSSVGSSLPAPHLLNPHMPIQDSHLSYSWSTNGSVMFHHPPSASSTATPIPCGPGATTSMSSDAGTVSNMLASGHALGAWFRRQP